MLHLLITNRAPEARLLPAVSRHMLGAWPGLQRCEPSAIGFHCWLLPVVQEYRMTEALLEVELPLTSRQYVLYTVCSRLVVAPVPDMNTWRVTVGSQVASARRLLLPNAKA